jgi:hypothetical protein
MDPAEGSRRKTGKYLGLSEEERGRNGGSCLSSGPKLRGVTARRGEEWDWELGRQTGPLPEKRFYSSASTAKLSGSPSWVGPFNPVA